MSVFNFKTLFPKRTHKLTKVNSSSIDLAQVGIMEKHLSCRYVVVEYLNCDWVREQSTTRGMNDRRISVNPPSALGLLATAGAESDISAKGQKRKQQHAPSETALPRLHTVIALDNGEVHIAFAHAFSLGDSVFRRTVAGECSGVVFELDDYMA